MGTDEALRTHNDGDLPGNEAKDGDDAEEEGSEGYLDKEDCLSCEGVRGDVDDKEVVPLHIAQQEGIDPNVDESPHKIYHVAIVAEPDNRL